MLRHRFGAEGSHRMRKAGLLPVEARVELGRGGIRVDPLSPLRGRAGRSVQNPLARPPDAAVPLLRPPQTAHRDWLPKAQGPLLAVEADCDPRVKVPLHAQAGVPVVWAVDPAQDQPPVFPKPAGEGYGGQEVLEAGELEVLGFQIPVKEVMP